MSLIRCEYYDKTKSPMPSLGDLRVGKTDLAHALLVLHGNVRLLNKIKSFASYYLLVISDFSFRGNDLKFTTDLSSCYDGLKRQKSELYAAMMTVIIAFNIYKQDKVYPFDSLVSKVGKTTRPDFIGEKNNTFSLFEAKGSIDTVTTKRIDDSIKQITSFPNLNTIGVGHTGIANRYSVACDLNYSTGKNVGLKIFDPDDNSDELIDFDLETIEESYYEYVSDLITSNNDVIGFTYKDKPIRGVEFNVSKDIKMVLGVEEEKFPIRHNYCQFRNPDIEAIHHFQNREEQLFSDGVYISLSYRNETRIDN